MAAGRKDLFRTMRTITHLVVHCTATPQTTTIESIQRYWRDTLKWRNPGYHYIIMANGEYRALQDIAKPANGVAGHNANSIHIAYIGGVDANGMAIDNRTPAQRITLLTLLKQLKARFPQAIIQGHRDFPNVRKDCPSFNARNEYSRL